jgi:hypothetical protein
VGAVAREAIATWLGVGASTATTQPNAAAPTAPPPAAVQPPAPAPSVIVSPAAAAEQAGSATVITPQHAVTTEAVTAEEAANAVALKPKRKEGEGGEKDVEKRWFDK